MVPTSLKSSINYFKSRTIYIPNLEGLGVVGGKLRGDWVKFAPSRQISSWYKMNERNLYCTQSVIIICFSGIIKTYHWFFLNHLINVEDLVTDNNRPHVIIYCRVGISSVPTPAIRHRAFCQYLPLKFVIHLTTYAFVARIQYISCSNKWRTYLVHATRYLGTYHVKKASYESVNKI